MTLRQAVGYLGILLPFVLAIGSWLIFHGGLQGSVSDYYYTPMRGVLIGGLCVIGAFLIAYYGYDRWDKLFTNCLLYTSPSPRDLSTSRMPSSA